MFCQYVLLVAVLLVCVMGKCVGVCYGRMCWCVLWVNVLVRVMGECVIGECFVSMCYW